MRRYVNTYPTVKAFLKFSKWAEFEAKNITLARMNLEAAFQELEPEELKQARLFKQFASLEERQGEFDRARVIYQHAVQVFKLGQTPMPKKDSNDDEKEEEISENEQWRRDELYKAYVTLEKKHGNCKRIESAIFTQQRNQYKTRLENDPYDYDGWFELPKLEEEQQNSCSSLAGAAVAGVELEQALANVRDTYERAVANIPPDNTNKDAWRRYIYLWIFYAVYEELTNHDLESSLASI